MKAQKNIVAQLTTVFFSTLDALRGVWRTSNVSIILFSLFFFKRIVALSKEGNAKYHCNDEILNWAENFKKTVVEHPDRASKDLILIFTEFAKLNPTLNNIFLPFIMAMEQEKSSQHLLQTILMLDEWDFSSEAISIEDFGNFLMIVYTK